MRAIALRTAAVAVVAAGAVTATTAVASAAPRDVQHVTSTSQVGKSTSASVKKFSGGTVTITVDATGNSGAKHTAVLTVNGVKAASESYTDKGGAKTWTLKNVKSGTLKLTAPASKGQVTKITLSAK
ncbi:hypothetical protein ACJ6WF_43805 [Streptomyces sp. MMS24-I2-30]|uniref:hypothetical protein n=1 Tax=Streptomyces sp. MMS24-I2-30 TaxID=3351564 RepID=UPI003896A53D